MIEEFSTKEKMILEEILPELPISEKKFKIRIKELYPKIIIQPFIIKIIPKTKNGVIKIDFTSDFKKELTNKNNNLVNVNSSNDLEKLITSIIQTKLDPILERITNIEKNIESINNNLKKSDQELKNLSKIEFVKKLKIFYDKIDIQHGRGGMIPIPLIWNKFKDERIQWEHFINYLYELEKERVIDLQIASDSKLIPNPELAIDDSIRGLLYYIVWRK